MSTHPLPESDAPSLREAAASFAALGSEQRLGVLRALVRAGPEGLTIGELGLRTGITGSTLSHHMRILADAGLVNRAREGRRIICVGAAYGRMQALADYLLSECCADSPETEPQTHG